VQSQCVYVIRATGPVLIRVQCTNVRACVPARTFVLRCIGVDYSHLVLQRLVTVLGPMSVGGGGEIATNWALEK